MSTTVNVKVDKSQLSQQLKDQAARSRFEAEKEGTSANPSREERQQQEAVDEAVRQVLGVQGDDGQLKLKKRRRQLAASREQLGQGRAQEELLDGIVPLARVGLRRSSDGRRFFVYPWASEAILGRRLSSNYNTAKQEAEFLGIEIDFTKGSLPELPPEPVGQKGGGPFVGYAGFSYDRTPYTFALFRTAQFFTRIDGRYTTDITRLGVDCVLDAKNTIAQKYDFLITKQINFGPSSNCYYFAGYNADDAAAGGTFTDKAFQDIYVSTGAGPSRSTYEILLPVGDQRVLVVLVHRNLLEFAHLRAFWQTEGQSRVIKTTLISDSFFSSERVETDVSYEGVLDTSKMSVNLDGAITNEVRCVLVTNTTATEIEPPEELVAACDLLVERLDASKATADLETAPLITKTSFANLETTSRTRAPYKYKGFEASNLPKAPYYETPAEQQVLAKQFGMGYLGTTNHAGNFITPAIFDWFTKQPTLNTSYAPHISRYQASFDNDSKPFPGFYLDVPAAGFEGEVMTAILATPQDINTKVTATAEQSIEIETQSLFGDYLVWDWGNPEYCRERLTQLGMGVLF